MAHPAEVAQVGAQALVPADTPVAEVGQVLVPAGMPVAEVAQVAVQVAVRADSREPRQGRRREVLPADAGVVDLAEVAPVVPVDAVVPAVDRRVPESRVGRSVVNSTIWKLRP